MKANEFVQKFGWEEASEIVAGVPSKYMECYYSTLCWCNRNKKYSDRFKPRIDLVNIADLKRLVESYELVESFGGLEMAKKFFDENIECKDSDNLKQAIADVESVEGLKEVT